MQKKKFLIPLNLQLFNEEPLPNPVVIDNVDDDDDVNDPPNTPLPVAVVSNNPANPMMPSSLAAEAWRNVEELLVTLSNNIRVSAATQRGDIEQLRTETVAALAEMRSTLHQVSSVLAEFTVLMANATVEVPVEEEPDDKPKSRGYHSRKGR